MAVPRMLYFLSVVARQRRLASCSAIAVAAAWLPAFASEGGVSFWLPGNFGSFAAAPSEPGWALPLIYFHGPASAGANIPIARGGRLTAGIKAQADFLFAAPTYTFASPVAGGQAAISMAAALGRVTAGIDATLAGPNGGVLSGSERDARTGVSDLYPTATLKWNQGAHNFMAYAAAGVPVGAYDANRLANIGINHWALDGGGGYTYFDDKSGTELSAVLGFTYNLENPDTHYRNGVEAHLDWAASHFFSPTFHAGIVGYVYHQLSGDSGSGATLGDFKSKVSGIGPQAGWFFKVGENKWYINLKGYYEFDAQHRPYGWNAWLTLAIPLAGAKP
ncbi:MAG: transporter [Variovorax sp.]